MIDEQLDKSPLKVKDSRLLLGAMFSLTLLYLYTNVYTLNVIFVKYFFERGYSSFALRNLIPILAVVIVGVMFKRKMIQTPDKRMLKFYITWLCSLFIYFILFHFHFYQVIRELLRKPYVMGASREPEFLIKYIQPLFYPIIIAVILYLLARGVRQTETREL